MPKREMTATVYILEEKRVLLIMHRKLGKWLPPGGHVNPGELPHECAKREALEETGLEIEFLLHEPLWVDYPHAQSLPRPYMCLLENIPTYKDCPEHQHADFIYIAKPVGGALLPCMAEVSSAYWFTVEEISTLEHHHSIYPETQDTCVLLFKDFYKLTSINYKLKYSVLNQYKNG